jgi:hypothetical protein
MLAGFLLLLIVVDVMQLPTDCHQIPSRGVELLVALVVLWIRTPFVNLLLEFVSKRLNISRAVVKRTGFAQVGLVNIVQPSKIFHISFQLFVLELAGLIYGVVCTGK